MSEQVTKRGILNQHIKSDLRINVYQLLAAFIDCNQNLKYALKSMIGVYEASDIPSIKDLAKSLQSISDDLGENNFGELLIKYLAIGMTNEEKIVLACFDRLIAKDRSLHQVKLLDRLIGILNASLAGPR